jgi:hypothetical protein
MYEAGKAALLDFYSKLQGSGWADIPGWNSSSDPCLGRWVWNKKREWMDSGGEELIANFF